MFEGGKATDSLCCNCFLLCCVCVSINVRVRFFSFPFFFEENYSGRIPRAVVLAGVCRMCFAEARGWGGGVSGSEGLV